MRQTIQLFLLLVGASLMLTLSGYAAGLGSSNVKFGKGQNGGSECMGKGICAMASTTSKGDGSVPVTFVLVEDQTSGLYTLTLQFNISLMSSANHDYLYQHFLYSDGEPRPRFAFEADYTLTDRELCSRLGIEAGTLTITTQSHKTPNNIEKLSDSEIRLTYLIPMKSGR